MDTKDPLIEAAVKALAENERVGIEYSDRLVPLDPSVQQRVKKLVDLWGVGKEEQATKLAYEWVKTGTLSYGAFHNFIQHLIY